MGSCAPIREDLAACIVKTDCFLVDKRTAQDCLTNHMAELPTECQHLYKSYVECRRAMLDMRKRFRGNKASASSSNNPPGGTTAVESSISSSETSSST